MFTQIRAYYKQLLPQLTNEEWQAIEDCITVKHLKKGDHLVKQGEVCNHVSFINKGLIRFYMLIDGKEIPTGFFMQNQYGSAYESFLTRQPSNENIDVLEDVELLQIDYSCMQMLYNKLSNFSNFWTQSSRTIVYCIKPKSSSFTNINTEQRYQKLVDKWFVAIATNSSIYVSCIHWCNTRTFKQNQKKNELTKKA